MIRFLVATTSIIFLGGLLSLGTVELTAVEPGIELDSVPAAGRMIGILLLEGQFNGSIEADSGSLVLNWRGGSVTVSSPLTFRANEDSLQLGDRWFREAVRVRATHGDMQIGHRLHEGWVEWLPDTHYAGGWKMIERLPMERYLIGVVSREMSASTFPAAALEAQAVAARTYSLFHVLTGDPSRRYHVYGDTRSQAYGGTARVPQAVIDAVKNTEGMILLSNGEIFESFYHSTCGGKTCSVSEAFLIAEMPVMSSISCTGCTGSKFFRWDLEVKDDEIRRALEEICEGTGVKVGSVQRLVPVDTTTSGHIPYLKVVHSSGSFEVDSQRLRRALASSTSGRLRSTCFEVRKTSDGFFFAGRGWGHGIGMCQVGAKGYALRGANRTWILRHYYPGAQIRRLW